MSVDDYILNIEEDKKEVFLVLRSTILSYLPKGFEETLYCGMIGFVVPHSIYPKGYHCKPKDPLPFISIGVNKKGLVLHHLGFYADEGLKDWFVQEYPKYCKRKVNMGKGCVNFKFLDEIPLALIQELVKKISVDTWIQLYEEKFNSSKVK